MAEHTEHVEDGADDVIEETTTVTSNAQDDIQTGEIDAVTTQDESDDAI